MIQERFQWIFVFVGSPLFLFFGLYGVMVFVKDKDLGLVLGIGVAIGFFLSMGFFGMMGESLDNYIGRRKNNVL